MNIAQKGFYLLAMAIVISAFRLEADHCLPYQPWEFDDCNETKGKFYVVADVLYARVTLDDLSIGNAIGIKESETITGDPAVTTHIIKGKGNALQPNPEFSVGWRTRLIYEFPSKWLVEVAAGAIRGAKKMHAHVVSPSEITINSTTFPIFSVLEGNPLSFIETSFALSYTVFGANVGKVLEPMKGVLFVPYFGFGALLTKEDYNYNGKLETSTGVLPLSSASVDTTIRGNLKERSGGYGLDIGVWAYWNIIGDFSLWGRLGATTLYTTSHTEGIIKIDQVNETGLIRGVQNQDIKDRLVTGTPTMNTLVGLMYNIPYHDAMFSIRAAWEQHIQVSAGRNAPVQGYSFGIALQF